VIVSPGSLSNEGLTPREQDHRERKIRRDLNERAATGVFHDKMPRLINDGPGIQERRSDGDSRRAGQQVRQPKQENRPY
jgi:hypothetical protein